MIDTIAFEPNPSGIFINIPSSARKRTIERLTLTEDRLRLRYETTVEDPEYLEKPVSFTMLWDHRPDLKPSPKSEGPREPAIARRYLEDADPARGGRSRDATLAVSVGKLCTVLSPYSAMHRLLDCLSTIL